MTKETADSLENVCRACMTSVTNMRRDTRITNHKQCISEKPAGCEDGPTIMELLQMVQPLIKVQIIDDLPKLICAGCIQQLQSTHKFIDMYRKSDEKFRKLLKEVYLQEETTNLNALEGSFEELLIEQVPNNIDDQNESASETTKYEIEIENLGETMSIQRVTLQIDEYKDAMNDWLEFEDDPINVNEVDEAEQSEDKTEVFGNPYSDASDNEWTPKEDARIFDDNFEPNECPTQCVSGIGDSDIKCNEMEYITEDNTEILDATQSHKQCASVRAGSRIKFRQHEKILEKLAGSDEEFILPHVENQNSSAASKKRKQNRKLWKSKIRKRLRESGESYVSINDKTVPARTMKAPCENCYLKCANVFTAKDRLNIFQSFWNMTDEEKNLFYFKFVAQKPIKRRRTNSDKKQFSFNYYFEKDETTYRVCRTFFMNTLSIDQKRIYYCFAHLKDENTGCPLPRKKGKNVKRVTPPNKLSEVREHIASFPTIDSHYCRSKPNKRFVEESLNLNRMYKRYVQVYANPVAIHVYRGIFNNEFNIGFYKPYKRSV